MILNSWIGNVSERTQRHRLDAQDRLCDLDADPGQKTPVGTREPEHAARLAATAAPLSETRRR
jgi:hypothetical protein